MRTWLSRLLIGFVFVFNTQCALTFWLAPQRYAPAYELSGELGNAMVRGFAVLFMMWNVPHALALWHPVKYQLALWIAIVMQAIGVIGETLILFSLPAQYIILRASITRFIVFDTSGLFFLLLASVILNAKKRRL